MNWLSKITKFGKFANERSAICEYCSEFLIPRSVEIKPNHYYNPGQMFICACGKSRMWTNAIRNVKSFIDFIEGKPNWRGEVEYINGFCNDKYCGYTFEYLQPLKNGISVPGFTHRLDRFGNPNHPINNHIAMDLFAEGREADMQPIIDWYSKHIQEVKNKV